MKGGGGEWEEHMRGERHWREGLLILWGEGSIIFIKGLYFYVLKFGGGMLEGSIGCWEFLAWGPGILTESWS
jgi:hypothetical protein